MMKNALVILAGGKGKRFGQKIPKQFLKIGNTNFLNYFISNLDLSNFDIINISIDKKYQNTYFNHKAISKKIKITYSKPGLTRQISSFNALKNLKKFKIKNVLIHDAARPLCSNKLIKRIISKLGKNTNAIPYVEYNDRQLIKKSKLETKAINVQTPQGFNYNLILKEHIKYKNFEFNDDAGLLQKSKIKINLIKGEKNNIKITYPEDIQLFNLYRKPITKYGIGYDIHQIDKKTKNGLKLGGVKIPFSKLIGHSDADVVLHAICDSIFGALSMRDIGYHFPNTDKKWKNADSSKFIIYCRNKLKEKGYSVINLDINIIAEKPKINKYVSKMIKNISTLLQIKNTSVSIKATTNEKIGFIGNGEGIAAESIVHITDDKIS